MATPRQKAQVGIFLAVCSLLLVATLVVLSGWQREKTIPYVIEFDESVSGLFSGADVRYRGVPVGRVTNITVLPTNQILVTVETRPSIIAIREGMTARLSTTGITGQLYIELTGGNPDAPPLAAGKAISSTPSLFANLSTEFPTILASINSVLLRLDKALGEEGHVVTILQSAEKLIIDLNGTMTEVGSGTRDLLDRIATLVESDVSPLVADLRTSAQATQRLLTNIGPPLHTVLTSGARTLQQLERQLGHLDLQSTNASAQQALQRISQLAEQFAQSSAELNLTLQQIRGNTTNVEFQIRQAARHLRETLLSAKQLFDYLEQDPSALLVGKRAPAPTRDGRQR